MQDRAEDEAAHRVIKGLAKWVLPPLCAVQMYTLALVFHHQWYAMGSSRQWLSVLFLCIYPMPLLQLTRKNINPYAIAFIAYIALGSAVMLMLLPLDV